MEEIEGEMSQKGTSSLKSKVSIIPKGGFANNSPPPPLVKSAGGV